MKKRYLTDLEIIMDVYPDISEQEAREMVINIHTYECGPVCLTII